MKTWRGSSEGKEIEIREVEFDNDAHDFRIIVDGEYIGSIHPDSPEDTKECVDALDESGIDVEGWEDGCGNTVRFDADSAFYEYWHTEH